MDPKAAELLYYGYVKAGCEGAFDRITDRPVVADKNRSWVGHLDQLFHIWPEAKVLVPVRDMRGVLTSMEKIFRAHPSPINGPEGQNPQTWTTTEKRVQGWLATPPVGIAIERVFEAASRFKDRLLFVHAEDLTSQPKATMQKVWEYLGEDFDGHEFNHVEQYTVEHEVGWPYGDHSIRQQVKPLKNDFAEVLGRNLAEQINQKFNWIQNL